MNKEYYKNSMEHIKISEDFYEETTKRMKATRSVPKKIRPATKLIVSFACAAVIVTAGTFSGYHLFGGNSASTGDRGNTYTVASVELKGAGSGKADMLALFVYGGRVYLHYNTAIETTDGVVSKADMLALRGEYLGTTHSGINELSGSDAYVKDFSSNIGESDIYTVKGYDNKYRLMAYTEFEDGTFGCDIYDSFGGLSIDKGADFFDLLHLKENISSYQWESFDSWNNGGNVRQEGDLGDSYQGFIKQLYEADPIAETPEMMDMLINNTSADSQKFMYIVTKDHLTTNLRLLKNGYVYIPQVGFFQVDKAAFDAFYNSLQ